MAASVGRACASRDLRVLTRRTCLWNKLRSREFLSSAYPCEEEWNKRLDSPVLKKIESLTDLAMKLHDRYEKQLRVTAVDIDVVANTIHAIDKRQLEFVEGLFSKFRCSKEAIDVLPSTPHALIRGYLRLGEAGRLLDILKDKIKFGIFMDPFTSAMLLDHFIETNNTAGAASVVYELMLQEDFSHPISRALSMYACCLRLNEGVPHVGEPYEPQILDDEEYDWQAVSYITNLCYDDHFDIQSERFLLGKTMNVIGRGQDDLIGRCFQVIGLGFRERFEAGLGLLEKYLESDQTVTRQSLDAFKMCIDEVQTRPEKILEKPPGTLTMEDEIYKIRLTDEQKHKYSDQFVELLGRIEENPGMVSEDNLEDIVKDYVTAEVPKHERSDADAQVVAFGEWDRTRQQLVDSQIEEYLKKKKLEEIQERVDELREREEYLTFFDKHRRVLLSTVKAPKKAKKEEKWRRSKAI